jgi:undecaprenyl-diphosphatase
MTFTQSAVLAVIEGLTEFLPVSSTGHMILASAVMKMQETEFEKSFKIAIQLGAVLSIALIYAKQFLKGTSLYRKLAAAFLPIAVIGPLAYHTIKTYLLNNQAVVAVSLIVGGVILILVDKHATSKASSTPELEMISYKNAFLIGLIQCVSMIPGVSRAAATIIGGIFNGLDKKQATEFSFLLAVPTMCAATGYDLLKTHAAFSSVEVKLLLLGLAIAFAVAGITVLIFRSVVERYGFKHFGYYRIAVGLIFLLIIT